MTLGARVRRLREQRRMSVQDLARAAQISHVTLVRLEGGAQQDVTLETAKKLARALRVSVDYLGDFYNEGTEGESEILAAVAV